MMGLALARRARLALLAVLILALLLFFPMRLAIGLIGLDRTGVAARAIHGSVWDARIDNLTLGGMSIGTVWAGLSPIELLVGRARIDIGRKAGAPDDIAGGLSAGFNRMGIDDVTGNLPLGAAIAPLPVSGMELSAVSAHFAGDQCADAEGQAKARIIGQIPGLNLSQGLSGSVRCDGLAVLFPLVSQSGMEKLNLRLFAGGRYVADMIVGTRDPALARNLRAAGFVQAGETFVLKIDGSL